MRLDLTYPLKLELCKIIDLRASRCYFTPNVLAFSGIVSKSQPLGIFAKLQGNIFDKLQVVQTHHHPKKKKKDRIFLKTITR